MRLGETILEDERLHPAKADIGNRPPDYPAEAARRLEHGTVGVKIYVDATGAVTVVEVARSSGSRVLDLAAQRQLATWHFSPATRGGRAVPDIIELNINFDLE